MSTYTVMKSFLVWSLLLALVAVPSCKKSHSPVESGDGSLDFTLTDLDGNTIKLSDLRGKVVMLEFWATWCPPCRDSVPEMNALYQKYKDRGLVLLGLSMDKGQDVQALLRSFVKEYAITYPVLHDKSDVHVLYGVYSIPASILIDRGGKVAGRHLGFSPSLGAMLSRDIEALL